MLSPLPLGGEAVSDVRKGERVSDSFVIVLGGEATSDVRKGERVSDSFVIILGSEAVSNTRAKGEDKLS
jgi:hypothetical protein